MQKLEIKLDGSRDEILKEISEIKNYFSSFNIVDNEMSRIGKTWEKTGMVSHWKAFENYSLADSKISACKTYLLTLEVVVRNNVAAKEIQEKSIDYFKKSYAEFVSRYEEAEKAEKE